MSYRIEPDTLKLKDLQSNLIIIAVIFLLGYLLANIYVFFIVSFPVFLRFNLVLNIVFFMILLRLIRSFIYLFRGVRRFEIAPDYFKADLLSGSEKIIMREELLKVRYVKESLFGFTGFQVVDYRHRIFLIRSQFEDLDEFTRELFQYLQQHRILLEEKRLTLF